MKIDEKWYKLYEILYGKEFNRILTIGNLEKGYYNFNIRHLDELRKHVEKNDSRDEFYVSLYTYNTKDNVLRWTTNELDKYEEFAQKNCILLRFKENTNIIQEEITGLDEIQRFMFIRRSINLGCNRNIVEECRKAYNFFKAHFNIKGIMMFNGFDECLLYLYTNTLTSLNNASLTYHNISKLIKEKLDLETLNYENIEPYAQIVPLPGTQNNNTRLHTQLYFPEFDYDQTMKNGQKKFLDEEHLHEPETSDKLEEFIINVDNEIHKSKNEKYDFDKIWDKI